MTNPMGFDREVFEVNVYTEQLHQLKKFGVQKHVDVIWLTILNEEIGEVSKATLDDLFGNASGNLETELIQCVAVIISWLESRNDNRDSWEYRQNLLKALTENKIPLPKSSEVKKE